MLAYPNSAMFHTDTILLALPGSWGYQTQ